MAEARRILITGGGIAGLSLAIALRRRGYTPELAEQCPRWPAAGAGIALHANAVRALRALGLGDAVSRAAAPLPRYGFYDQHGAQLCTTDLDDLWGQPGPAWESPGSGCKRSWPRRRTGCRTASAWRLPG